MALLTTAEAADKLGISARRVQELIKAGRLPAQQFGRTYVVEESDLKLVEDRKPGRPSKKASGTDGKVNVKVSKKGGRK